jgi:hypothetical protein
MGQKYEGDSVGSVVVSCLFVCVIVVVFIVSSFPAWFVATALSPSIEV